MLQLIVTWQIKLSCDRFTSLIKINVIQYSRNALYICICYGSNFFPVKILPSAPEMLYLYVFFFQSETVIYLVTEPVRPLEVQLNEEEKSDLAISWGLHQITVSIILNRYA